MASTDSSIFAFVLMPFDKAFDDIYRLGIKETTAQLGIKAERVDEQISTKEYWTGFIGKSKLPI
ncbi:MAG: hypothetical protein QY310_12655 [Candidatus Jettenia sp. CY-1]|nr:MAG: hypothetical protein QY310_12655 [Candidatus Jettenia sp. CY-1]